MPTNSARAGGKGERPKRGRSPERSAHLGRARLQPEPGFRTTLRTHTQVRRRDCWGRHATAPSRRPLLLPRMIPAPRSPSGVSLLAQRRGSGKTAPHLSSPATCPQARLAGEALTGNRTCSATPTCCVPSPGPPPPPTGSARLLLGDQGRLAPTHLRASGPGIRRSSRGAPRAAPGAPAAAPRPHFLAAGCCGLSGKPQRCQAHRLQPAPL